jgi:outer membrane receptor for ferrienterochelin and colicins
MKAEGWHSAWLLPGGLALAVLAGSAQAQPDSEPVLLDPVVVTGTRTEHRLSDSPVEVQVIGERRIRESGARSVAELLEREGGVYVVPVASRGSTIEMQGLSSEHVLVLVDGRRAIGRVNGAIDLGRYPLENLARIEIVQGPSSALYGSDALGGVVNLITRRGTQRGGAVTVRADADDNREVQGHGAFELGALDGQLSAGLDHREAYDIDPDTVGTDGADGDGGFASLASRWNAKPWLTLDIDASYAREDSEQIDGDGPSSYELRKRVEDSRLALAPQLRLGPNTELRLDGSYARYDDQFLQLQQGGDGSDDLDEETHDELIAVGGQLDHRVGLHRMSLGGEHQFERLESDRLEAGAAERDRQGVFGQDEWTLLDGRLMLVPGLRYDRDSQFGDQWSPKFALRYALTEDLLLRAGYGRGYRAPDFKQLLLRFENPAIGYRVDGNPDLDAETSRGYQLGLTWLPSERASFSLGGYYNRVSDLIEIVLTEAASPIVYSYRNVADATVYGIDAQVRYRPWTSLTLETGYSWLHSRNEETGEALSGRPRHRVNAALRYARGDWTTLLRGVWVDSRTFALDLDTGGAPTPAGEAPSYALFDARLEWRHWQPWTVAAGVRNLFDEGDATYLPVQPRTAYAELRWSFE